MATKDFVPFYVTYGGEDFLLDQDIERAHRWRGRRAVVLDGRETDEHALIDELDTPLTDTLKTVILDHAQKVKEGKTLKAFFDKRDLTDEGCILLAVVRDEKLTSFWASVGKKGKITERKKLKSWESDNQVASWVSQEAGKIGLSLDDVAAEAIVRVAGTDLYRLASELRKLLLLVGKGVPVTPAHLSLVVTQGSTIDVFQVLDAASDRDVGRALKLLSRLYDQEGDAATISVVYGLMRQVEKLLVARLMLDRNADGDEIAARLAMHPWRCKQHFLPTVRKHSARGLGAVMQRLCQLDEDVKRGGRSKRTLLDLTLVMLATGSLPHASSSPLPRCSRPFSPGGPPLDGRRPPSLHPQAGWRHGAAL